MNSKQLAVVMRMISRTSTVAAICASTGITRQTIYKTLRALEAARVARICNWNQDGSGRAVEPVWALGDQPSAQRTRMSNAEKQRNYRQRKKKSESVMSSLVAVATAAASKKVEDKKGRSNG